MARLNCELVAAWNCKTNDCAGVAPVVVTVAVTARAVVVGVKVGGLKEQPTPAGSGATQLMVTAPGEEVLVDLTLSENVVEPPCETTLVGVELVMVNDGVVAEMTTLTF